jgi:hypothetical protein
MASAHHSFAAFRTGEIMSRTEKEPVHSGNYYTAGVQRVLAKLGEMKIDVPALALEVPPHTGAGQPAAVFTRIEHAMLDWFEGRDYDQAQGLIHFRPRRDEWHVIHLLDEEKAPRELSPEMLCPSRLDALGAVINACDYDTLRLDTCRQEGDALIVAIQGRDSVRIEPVPFEPFSLAIRDRVRTAFKGVRSRHQHDILTHAARLPGFKRFLPTGKPHASAFSDDCTLIGFPTNWAFAMRAALKQVGIAVKQSQAQELAAVFFGASHWHQLIKHQHEINDQMAPVAVSISDSAGRQSRYYRTTEEALFAVGQHLAATDDGVVCQDLRLSLDKARITCWMAKESAVLALPPQDRYRCESWLTTGSNDYWSLLDDSDDATADAAKRLLEAVGRAQGETTTLGVLYDNGGDAGLLEGVLGRFGVPSNQIVLVGDHALAVSYVPQPDGGPRMAARLQIFRITAEGPHKLENGDIAMYKAKTRVRQEVGGLALEIRADYGHEPAIVIPVAHRRQLEQLKALTHPPGIFTREPFDLGEETLSGAVH